MKENIIIIIIVALIVFLAIFYIIKAKKNGQKCIGCPYSKECSKKCCCNSTINEDETIKQNNSK